MTTGHKFILGAITWNVLLCAVVLIGGGHG